MLDDDNSVLIVIAVSILVYGFSFFTLFLIL